MKRDDQLTLKEAHHVTARAVAKTEALRQSGCFVAADLSGEPVAVRRMDATAGGAYDIVRGKALGAALLGESSSSFAARVLKFPPQIFAAYQRLMRAQPFPGAGAVPLLRGAITIGAISSGVRIGPFVKLPGVDPAELLVDGQPTNLEDLIISYAVGGPYRPEHGDDMARWQEAYGAAPAAGLTGTGLQEVPLATRQPVLDNAMARAARVIAHANALGEAVTVVLADRHGHVITVDRMDGAPPATVRMAEGVALTAAALQIRTCELAGNPPALSTEVLHSIGPHLLPLAGGCPLFANGEYLGAIGIAGRHPVRAQQLADQAAIPE